MLAKSFTFSTSTQNIHYSNILLKTFHHYHEQCENLNSFCLHENFSGNFVQWQHWFKDILTLKYSFVIQSHFFDSIHKFLDNIILSVCPLISW